MRFYTDFAAFDDTSLFGRGDLPAKYAVIAAAPSLKRPYERRNEPFGSAAWYVTSRIFDNAARGSGVYVSNLVKSPMPLGKALPKRMIDKARPILQRELSVVQPRRILALGSDVARVLCPGFQNMTEDHGALFTNDQLADMLGQSVVVVPTFHFAAVYRNPLIKPIVARDIARYFELPAPKPPKYKIVHSSEHAPIPDFKRGENVYIDIESTGLDPREPGAAIISLGLGVDRVEDAILYERPTTAWLIKLYRALHDNKVVVIGQNFQFDLYWLSVLTGIDWLLPVHDTMLISHNQGNEVVNLKHMTTMLTDRPGPHSFGSFHDAAYAAEDVHSTREVYQELRKKSAPTYIDDMLDRAIPELVANRRRGVFIDRPLLAELTVEYRAKVNELRAELNQAWEVDDTFNWRSGDMVRSLLLARNVRLVEKTKSGKYSVKEAVLQTLADDYPTIKLLLDYRAADKTLNGFFETYLKLTTNDNPFLYPFQDLKGARTGRTSMKGPNLQQVTKVGPSKRIFRSRWRHGGIGLCDIDAAELRVAALLSNDRKFAENILTGDPHAANAALVYNLRIEDVPPLLRTRVKQIVFGLLYGGSVRGLAYRLGVSPADVQKVVDQFYSKFPVLMRWVEQTKALAVKNLYGVDLFGRRRDYRGLFLAEGARSVERKGVNTPVQALASHIAIRILTETSVNLREGDLHSLALFGIHDSTFFDVSPADRETDVYAAIQNAFYSLNNTPLVDLPLWRFLPITGELHIGETWAAIEKTNEYFDKPNMRVYKCSTHNPPMRIGGKKGVSHGVSLGG